MDPIGVLGGAFDPVHYGHLRTALEVQQTLGLAEIRFVPCGEPPHRSATVAASELRLAMLEAAIVGNPAFVADRRELDRPGPSYTVDTLAELREDFPGRPLCLIIGMDAFLGLPGWHRPEQILATAHLVIAHRPGWTPPSEGGAAELLREHIAHSAVELSENIAGRIFVYGVTQLEISSSTIRQLIGAGEDPRYLLPDAVRAIIRASGSYAGEGPATGKEDLRTHAG